jgi:hypothetical protein
MRNVLLNEDLQGRFEKDGFVKIPLLGNEDIMNLSEILKELKEESQKGQMNIDSSYKLSFFSSSPEYRKTVLERIGTFFQPKVDRFLNGYKPLIINVFDKEPGTGEVPIHQNWTFVDEDKFTSVSVWIPLIDTTRENGTMEVVRGSQRVLTKYRAPNIPWVFEGMLNELKEKYLEPIDAKLGEAEIIDDSIIHWTSQNDTSQVRTAIQLIMIPNESTPIHYYKNPGTEEDKLEIFEVDSDFFTRFNMQEKPMNVKSIGFVDFKYKALSEQDFVKRIAVNNPGILEKA